MNGMASSPDAPGGDPGTVTGIRAIGEPGERLVEVEITVCCSRAGLWKDRPGEHPWYGQFRHQLQQPANMKLRGLWDPRATHGYTLVLRSSAHSPVG
jgi:hypothetical protein